MARTTALWRPKYDTCAQVSAAIVQGHGNDAVIIITIIIIIIIMIIIMIIIIIYNNQYQSIIVK